MSGRVRGVLMRGERSIGVLTQDWQREQKTAG